MQLFRALLDKIQEHNFYSLFVRDFSLISPLVSFFDGVIGKGVSEV